MKLHTLPARPTREPNPSTKIEIVQEATDELVKAFGRLLPQLSRTAPAPDADALRDVLSRQSNRMFVARVDGEIVGTLTLVVFPIPTGVRAWIEDVVVDEPARGLGVGAALTRAAVQLARSAGARTVDLTSRPSRAAANRLYERLGFRVRDSKVYRLETSAEDRDDASTICGAGRSVQDVRP